MEGDVLLAERTGNVRVLTLNRPEVGNALNPELTGRLIAAMGDADGERRWAGPDDIDAVFRSADAMEGARAFAERRPPSWTGT